MSSTPRLWMRSEVRPTERRAPIVPADARLLVQSGVPVTVEDSAQRVFPISEYAAAGCRIVEPGSWVGAPAEEFIVGLKELPDQPDALVHRHVFFGHAYKKQGGAERLLQRFAVGGGTLLDSSTWWTPEDTGWWPSGTGPAMSAPHSHCCITAAGSARRWIRW